MSVASDAAQAILTDLGLSTTVPPVDLSGDDFELPDRTGNPRYDPIARRTITALTEGTINGNGTFDKVMAAQKAHIEDQFEKGRLTGDQYVKAYIELTSLAMTTGLQFLLQEEAGYWEALTAQSQARRAEIEAVTAAVQLETAKKQMLLVQIQYALAMMQLATEDAKYELTQEQIELVDEQKEAARAQTVDTRKDLHPVNGLISKQKQLYDAQIGAYTKDHKHKVAKLWSDAYITQSTIDEGTPVPAQFGQTEINEVLVALRTDAGLGS